MSLSGQPALLIPWFLSAAFLCGCGGDAPKALPQSAFQVEFGEHQVPRQMRAGETVVVAVWLGNAGNHVWPRGADAKGRKQVNLSYHWLDTNRQVVLMDGLRTPLLEDLYPGKTMRLNVAIQAPTQPGKYVLQISPVQEAVAWFHDKGGATLDVPVTVVAAGAATPPGLSKTRDRGAASKLTEIGAASAVGVAKLDPVSVVEVWSVQIAAAQQRAMIDKRVAALRGKGFDAYVHSARVNGKVWYQARVGHLMSKADAEALQKKLSQTLGGGNSIVTSRQ